ncbi:MAG: hypothetical protein QM759_05260 [Terricaulis sp.]
MRAASWIAMTVVVLGFGVGWVAVKPPTQSGPTRAGAVQRPVSGGEFASAALDRFSKLVPIAADPPPDAGPPPPPPPDVAITFRRELTAIDVSGREPVVYIVDYNGEHGRRGLRKGDVYRDGWRVNAIADQEVVLRRRRELRTIAIFDLPEADTTPQ